MASARDGFQFRAGKDFAAGIGRRVDDDAARAWRDGAAQRVEIERPVRQAERNRDGLDAQRAQRVQVVAIERFEEDDLVARIEQRHAGGLETGGRA